MRSSRRFSTYDIVIIGVMAALCFVTTAFLKIGPIPTPAGPTMLKVGNIVCLLAGLLFGGIRGGLSAGIGSALYDLTDPVFAASAPFTLLFFFIMGFVCGLIAHWNGRKGTSTKWNIIGAVSGAGSYLVLHIGKSLITLLLAGSGFAAAVSACGIKLITSGINAAFAVVVSVLLAPVFRAALLRAGFGQKLFPSRN